LINIMFLFVGSVLFVWSFYFSRTFTFDQSAAFYSETKVLFFFVPRLVTQFSFVVSICNKAFKLQSFDCILVHHPVMLSFKFSATKVFYFWFSKFSFTLLSIWSTIFHLHLWSICCILDWLSVTWPNRPNRYIWKITEYKGNLSPRLERFIKTKQCAHGKQHEVRSKWITDEI
jgi:hypothetical protein